MAICAHYFYQKLFSSNFPFTIFITFASKRFLSKQFPQEQFPKIWLIVQVYIGFWQVNPNTYGGQQPIKSTSILLFECKQPKKLTHSTFWLVFCLSIINVSNLRLIKSLSMCYKNHKRMWLMIYCKTKQKIYFLQILYFTLCISIFAFCSFCTFKTSANVLNQNV